MINYTENQLLDGGYTIQNVTISSIGLFIGKDILTLKMVLSSSKESILYGGAGLCSNEGILDQYTPSVVAAEYIMRLMELFDVHNLVEIEGKNARIAFKKRSDPIFIIGHIVDDRWFDQYSFFNDYMPLQLDFNGKLNSLLKEDDEDD